MALTHVRQVTASGQEHVNKVIDVRFFTLFVVDIHEFSSQQLCSENFCPIDRSRFLEENTGANFHGLGLVNYFLDVTPKAPMTKDR